MRPPLTKTKKPPHWDDLRHFLAVARTGTLSAAADLLDTDHSTVARRIQRLEEWVGAHVFYRSRVGYALTGSGERLLPVAEAMEAGAISAANLESGASAVAGSVRVGAPDGFGTYFLAPRLGRLAQQHPQLQVEMMATARVFSLSKREAEIVISLTSPEDKRVVSRRLTDYRLGIYGARDYLAAHPPITSVDDLKRHVFIGYIEDLLYTPVLNYLGSISENLHVQIRSTNLVAQIEATRAGAGLCVIPAFMAKRHAELTPVLAEQISLTRSFFMNIHEDNRTSAPVRAAASFIAEACDGFEAF